MRFFEKKVECVNSWRLAFWALSWLRCSHVATGGRDVLRLNYILVNLAAIQLYSTQDAERLKCTLQRKNVGTNGKIICKKLQAYPEMGKLCLFFIFMPVDSAV